MKTFYVTFGGLLFNHHLKVLAYDEEIVRAWMNKKSGLSIWCSVKTEEPTTTQLNYLELYYTSAEHV